MREITGVLMCVVLCAWAVPVFGQVELASDNFKPLDYSNEYGWRNDSWDVSDLDLITVAKPGTSWRMLIGGESAQTSSQHATRIVNLENVTGAELEFEYKIIRNTQGSQFSVQVSDDGLVWTTILSTTDSSLVDNTSGITVDASIDSFDGEQNVYIRFIGTGIKDVDTFRIFDVKISGVGTIDNETGMGGDGTYIAEGNFSHLGIDGEYGWIDDDWQERGNSQDKLYMFSIGGTRGLGLIFNGHVDLTYVERGIDLGGYSAVKVTVDFGVEGNSHSSTDCFQAYAMDLSTESFVKIDQWTMWSAGDGVITFKEKSFVLSGDYLGSDSRLKVGVGYQREDTSYIDSIRVEAWETAAPISLELDANDDTGVSSSDAITNVTTGLQFNLAGLVDGADFTVYVDDVESTATVTVDTQDSSLGSFSLDLAEGEHVVSVTQTDTVESKGVSDPITLTVTVDTTPPLVSSVEINDGALQRHDIEEIEYTFSEDVTIAVGDLSVESYDEASSSWGSVTITGATLTGTAWNLSGLLSDSAHHVAVLADDVTDIAGNALDGNADQLAGGDHAYVFYRVAGDFNGNDEQDSADIDLMFDAVGGADMLYDLDNDSDVDSADVDELIVSILATAYGDSNLDGAVDTIDYAILQNNFGSGTTWAEGDYDGDDAVNISDFVIQKNNMDFENPNFDLVNLGAAPTYP